MIFDSSEGGRAYFARAFDVCVVGAGPAGITLARSLADKGLDVALMEAGDFDFTPQSQDFYAGERAGVDYPDLDLVRLRYFGGTSGHWTGTCRALDSYDFRPLKQRPWGWPIAKADLDPYQAAAAEILELGSPEELLDLPVRQAANRFRAIQWQYSPPVRFGDKYRREIVEARRIALCLNANLVDLRLDNTLSTVTAAVFKSYNIGDPGFEVRARVYCLCLGAIENARMLLNFRQKPRGIGNDHDLVGRYFCEHLYLRIGDMLYTERPARRLSSLAPTLDFIERQEILSFSLLLFAREDAPQSFLDATKETAKCFDTFTRSVTELLRGYRPACRSGGGLDEFRIRHDPDRFPSGWVKIAAEQALNADSRVQLTDEKDAFGLQRARLEWRLGEDELRTVRAAALALGMHMAEQNRGRLWIEDWVLADPMELPRDRLLGSYHHMCTTRMSDNPRQGVVDRDCRVHGTGNLYLGGSSVFATPGFANPTYTIVQLALRLGDHLGRRLRHANATFAARCRGHAARVNRCSAL